MRKNKSLELDQFDLPRHIVHVRECLRRGEHIEVLRSCKVLLFAGKPIQRDGKLCLVLCDQDAHEIARHALSRTRLAAIENYLVNRGKEERRVALRATNLMLQVEGPHPLKWSRCPLCNMDVRANCGWCRGACEIQVPTMEHPLAAYVDTLKRVFPLQAEERISRLGGEPTYFHVRGCMERAASFGERTLTKDATLIQLGGRYAIKCDTTRPSLPLLMVPK